jgi:CRISPR-associated protein Cas1
MDEPEDNSALMGYEGMASNIYFRALKALIPEDLGFNNRIKHPSPDPMNAMLSYGYGILYSKIRLALMKVNLNPFCGVLHAAYKSQEALVYDFIEEFRQPVVDRTILTLIGRKQVSPEDFIVGAERCEFKDYFKKQFASSILSRLESGTKYEGENKEFGEIINLQAKKLKDAIENRTDYKAFVYLTR